MALSETDTDTDWSDWKKAAVISNDTSLRAFAKGAK